jgi:hypothetical protein
MNSSVMAGGDAAQAAVLLVNIIGGGELESVRDALVQSLGTPALLINQADLSKSSISLEPGSGVLEVAESRIRPTVVWARHCSAPAIAAWARLNYLAAATWADFFQHLAHRASASVPGAAPDAAGQLADAARLGIRVPRTVVTTDVSAGVQRMRTPRVVIKEPDFRLYVPDSRDWQAHWPRIVHRDALPDDATGWDPAATRAPVIVQEYVEHAAELRVYYLNGAICAFSVGKPSPSSLWTDPDAVTVSQLRCPPEAARVVRALCAAWQLSYAAFDLLVTAASGIVFLEANCDGDWLFYERKARWHGVSFMAAVMVRDMFTRVAAA